MFSIDRKSENVAIVVNGQAMLKCHRCFSFGHKISKAMHSIMNSQHSITNTTDGLMTCLLMHIGNQLFRFLVHLI